METNVDADDMTAFYLARKGYGSLAEIQALDTREFLDLVEFEQIALDIESYRLEHPEG